MSGLITVAHFLTFIFFNLIIFAFWARFALRFLRISSLNSFSRLIYTLTNPIINPFYSLIRYRDKATQRYDWPVLIILFLVELLKILILGLVVFQTLLPLSITLLFASADYIIQPCNFLFFALLIRVLMSYINPHLNHPLVSFLYSLTNPLIYIGRKIIPDISGFDFSPFIMMIILKVITLFIQASLPLNLL